MPKLEGIEEKYWNGYKVDKENEDTVYSDEEHVYIDKHDNSKFISVTTLIHNYAQEFDEEFWSSYKALEELIDGDTFSILKRTLLQSRKFDTRLLKKFNIDQTKFLEKQNAIKDEYKRKREESCVRGTNIHAAFENSFYNKKQFDFGKYGYKDLVGQFECRKDYYKLDLENGVYPEFLISLTSRDGILKVAGQIDLLIKKGNDIYIIDWKSNTKIEKQSYYNKSTKKYQMMKFPLNHIMDSNYWHYTLQLSCYAYLLQQLNPDFNIKGLKIVHIDHDNKKHEYDVEYLKEDVEKMFKHYKRQLKARLEYDKLKPVIV